MSWHSFDKSGKWLIRHHGDSLLRLAQIANVVSWRPAQAELVQPGQLPDGLLEVQLAGQDKKAHFLLELATKAERRLTRQLVRDMMMVYLNFGTLPEALALVLIPRGRYRVPSGIDLHGPLERTHCHLAWQVVELWTVPAKVLLASKDVGLIPWVPLTAFDGPAETLIRECAHHIEERAPNRNAKLFWS